MFSIDGLVSGFNSTSIIESLLQFRQGQLDVFNSRKAEISQRKSAFGGIEAQLLSLRAALGKLNRSASVFDGKNVTSSNENIITAAAGTAAAIGNYTLTVNSLATAEQRASQGFSNEGVELGTGEFTLQVGNRPATSIQIDQTNNTVAGFVAAINSQSDDVSASVVFDQESDSYRILLTSNQTGAANTISVTSSLAGGPTPDFSGSPVQVAANASVTLGSGAGAITSQYATNQINNLISGVTLKLESANPSTPVTISVSGDTSSSVEAIEDFVEAFNKVADFIDNQTKFDPETNFASPLLGNRNVNQIRDRLLNLVIENVPGLANGLSRLADIGVDINTKGRLQLDSSRLNDALAGNIPGINPNSIRNLFGLNATSTNQGIRFVVGSDLTVANGEPIQVDILQAAEQATVTATDRVNDSIVINGTNNELTISVDGTTSETLTLASGTYTPQELAAQVSAVINSSNQLANRDVLVGIDTSNRLTITSTSYGSESEISSVSGSAAALLGFFGTEQDNGQDVAGSFIVSGVVETAVGRGQRLVGDAGNANTADLQVLVSLSSSQVGNGIEGELTVTRGITSQLDQYINDLLDPATGGLNTINEEFDSQIASIDRSIARVNAVTEAQRQSLIREFNALESILANLQNTSSILTSQLNSLTQIARRN